MAPRFRKPFQPLLRVTLALLTIVSISTTERQTRGADQLPTKSEAEKGAAVTDQPSPPARPPAAIEGFRQARFGMSEEQVRQAIRNDFPAAPKLASAVNPSEKTTILSLGVTDLLPRTGKAHISYIFGYQSKKLIQVNILWGSDRSAAADETIVGTANSLRGYFAAENFRSDSVVANRQLAGNTILVFRGSDDQKRTVLLVLSGVAATARPEDKKEPRPAPLTLELSYIEDAANPDVFRIGNGQF